LFLFLFFFVTDVVPFFGLPWLLLGLVLFLLLPLVMMVMMDGLWYGMDGVGSLGPVTSSFVDDRTL
jgi:hypothetical protein